MRLSPIGARLAGLSGLRSIMEDVASSTAGAAADEWLNLSVGNPATIPGARDMWQEALSTALAEEFDRSSCRYGPSRGSAALIDAIAGHFNRAYGWELTEENIVVGPGSQMVCFAAAALFAGPAPSGMRQVVLPLVPDYTGYQGLCMHEDGIAGIPPRIVVEGPHRFRYELDLDALARRRDMGMLLISSPGNPTGRSIDRADLDGLLTVAEERGIPLFIDHAYGAPFPRIADVRVEPVFHRNVVNCFSVSKAGLPGERIGFAIGDPEYIGALAAFMSNSVLHAPRLSQAAVALALRSGRLDEVTRGVISPYYRHKKQFMDDLLTERLPSDIAWRTHSGAGGMFSWVWVDHPWFDDAELYRRLKEKRVFVVPGRHFFVDASSDPLRNGHATRCFRMSLSAPEKVIIDGVDRVADTLREMRAAASAAPA
jgi:valine--pyruvate aminotransferase